MAALTDIDLLQEGAFTGLPMPLKFRPPFAMSDNDLIAFSRRNRPYQVERNPEGELEIMSPVGFDGARWEALVIRELGNWAERHGGVALSSNVGVTLPDGSMRSPDAAWVSEGQWARISREERRRFAPICPDFVIEILSESDWRPGLEAKMRMWIANGAQLAWMIDPYAATLSIYRAGGAVEMLSRPDAVEADEVVPGFRLTTRTLWAE